MPLFFYLAGIPKFILISVHDYNLPSFLLSSGYFKGKRKAESEVLSKYPSSGHYSMPLPFKKKIYAYHDLKTKLVFKFCEKEP